MLSPNTFWPILSVKIVVFKRADEPSKIELKAANIGVATSLFNTTGYLPLFTEPAPSCETAISDASLTILLVSKSFNLKLTSTE